MNSKSRTFFRRAAASGNPILILAIVTLVMTTASADVGTTFTYQGQLLDGSGVVDDTCDIQFSLYDAATDGAQVGSTVTKTNVDVDDGLFTVELDFGAGAFSGDPRWLELAVRCPAGSGMYDTLSPRQSIAPTPYAVYAAGASIASDVEPGAITPAHLNGLPGNGTSGQVLASDGSGGFEWQGVSSPPVKQLVQDFVVASGESVSAGDVVSFLNDQVYSPNAEWETESVFNAANTSHIAISALSATDFVVAYCDYGNSNYGTAITGTVSGGAVSWGSASVFNSDHTTEIAVSSLSATDFVVVYRDWGNSSYGAAIVGTVSGGALSWGTESVFNAALTFYIDVSSVSATDFVVAYRDAGNSGYGTARAGTVSGGEIWWGTESVFNAADTADIALSGLSATDFVVAYKDVGNSDYGTAIMGTVSGSTLSWGDESVFNAAGTGFIAVSSLSATDFVVAYRDFNSDYGTARVGMVSGSTLSWGTESVFNAALTFPVAISALSATEFVVAYSDWDNSEYGTARKCTVSGSSLTWGTESVFNAAATDDAAVSALSATVFVVVYRDEGSSDYGTARVGYHWQLVGTAKTVASGGETVTVIISGVSDVHSGLVPGKMYYLQADGSLGLTPTDYRVGLAISETELILDQLW
jgi:hypothetical protein